MNTTPPTRKRLHGSVLGLRRWNVALLLSLGAAAGLSAAAGCSPSKPEPSHASSATSTATSAGPASAKRALPADIAAAVTTVDGLLQTEWKQAGVSPSRDADEATFLRRAYLDLAGTIPTTEQAERYLSETGGTSESRRAALVAALTASPDYARHWTNYWDELLMAAVPGNKKNVDRSAFRSWLHSKISSGVGHDVIVRELISSSGQNGEGGRPNPSEWELPDKPAPEADGVNGAVNWLLAGAKQPQNVAGATSRIFLGVQIQCAECHDHPTETWKQDDFKRFTAAFMRTRAKPIDRGKVMGTRRVELADIKRPPRRKTKRMRKSGYDDKKPTALDGTSLEGDSTPRMALAKWITAPTNPWFAKALVNRMWAEMLGHGFTDPIDDFRKDQEVLAKPVLDALVKDFVSHGYDVRRLQRIIAASAAYQRSASGPALAENAEDPAGKLWARFALRPMNASQLLDSVVVATQLEPMLEDVVGVRLGRIKFRLRKQFTFAFDVDEESADDSFTGTVSQALMLLNGAIANAGSSALNGSTLGDAVRGKADPAAIEQLYLAALSRKPNAREQKHWQAFIQAAGTAPQKIDPREGRGAGPVGRLYRRKHLKKFTAKDAAYEDLFWALLNTSEFFFIH